MAPELCAFVILWLAPLLAGTCLFRHNGDSLISLDGRGIVGHRVVTDVSGCEKFCVEKDSTCLAANLVPIRSGVYSCELLGHTAQLIPHDGAISIVKEDTCTPNPCRNGGTCQTNDSGYKCACSTYFTGQSCETELLPVAIASCTTSSDQNEKYTCDNAYDEVMDPGDNNEWASYLSDAQPTLTMNFVKAQTIVFVDIWWRCRTEDQFKVVNFSYASIDVSINHTCQGSTYWLGCGDEPPERFDILPTLTSSVTLVGTEECPNSSYTGYREVKIWGY